MITFTEQPEGEGPGWARGGRHVEFGIALGNRYHRWSFNTPRLIVVGWRENVFHYLPIVEFYETWEAALAALGRKG